MRSFRLPALTVCVLITWVSVVLGQDKPAAETPDRVAYKQAVLQKDARARIEALRKFLAAYPKSGRAHLAKELILKTLVQNWPQGLAEIRDQVKRMTTGVDPDDKLDALDTVADILVTNGASQKDLTEIAARVETAALKSFDEKRLFAQQKRQSAGAKMPVADATLRHYVDEVHADLLTTMGRIEVARGNTAKGQLLLEQAHKTDAENSQAAAELGELALQAGRKTDALDLLVSAQLSGKPTLEQRQHLEELFKTLHPGEAGGLDAWLDQAYRGKYPENIHVEPYKTTDHSKTVLAELFTGAGCSPCAAADVALDAAMERFGKRDLVVLMYHEHIPEPDPMANPVTLKRLLFYGAMGTPTLEVDGESLTGGGSRSDAPSFYARVQPKIEAELKSAPGASLTVSASRSGSVVTVHARAESAKPLRLQIALAEKQLRYSGENGIRFHPMVVRAMADGFALNEPVETTFDVSQISADLKSYLDDYEITNDRFGPIHFSEKKYSIDPANLAVVAFVQDMETKRVLQATYLEPDAK